MTSSGPADAEPSTLAQPRPSRKTVFTLNSPGIPSCVRCEPAGGFPSDVKAKGLAQRLCSGEHPTRRATGSPRPQFRRRRRPSPSANSFTRTKLGFPAASCLPRGRGRPRRWRFLTPGAVPSGAPPAHTCDLHSFLPVTLQFKKKSSAATAEGHGGGGSPSPARALPRAA